MEFWVSDDTSPFGHFDAPSLELAGEHFPTVEIRGDFSGNRSFFNSTKAERLLGWKHPAGH